MSSEVVEHHELDMSGITAVEAATFNGGLTVRAGAEWARLEVTLKGKATYDVERLGTLLYIAAKKGGLTYFGSAASFTLWLPAGLALKLANVNGGIWVEGGARSLDAATVHGPLEVAATGQGELRLRSGNGPITVRGARGGIDVGTGNGWVRITEAQGQIAVASGNGRLEFADVAGQIKATTGNGEVRLVSVAGQLQVTTGNGAVRVERVTFAPGTRSSVKTGHGAVEVLKVAAPGGLSIRAKSGRPIAVELPGYTLGGNRYQLEAQLAGPNPARLDLAYGTDIRITS